MTATGRSWSRRDGRLARSGRASPPSGLGDRRDDGEWGALGPGRTLADAGRRRGRRAAARCAGHAAATRSETGSWSARRRYPKVDPQSLGDLPVSVADRPPGANGPHGRGPRGSLSISSTEVLRQGAYGPQLRRGTGVGALSSSVHVAPWSPATRDAATAIAAGGARGSMNSDRPKVLGQVTYGPFLKRVACTHHKDVGKPAGGSARAAPARSGSRSRRRRSRARGSRPSPRSSPRPGGRSGPGRSPRSR